MGRRTARIRSVTGATAASVAVVAAMVVAVAPSAPNPASASATVAPHIDGATFVPLTPCRVADSRGGPRWAAGERRTLRVAGAGLAPQGGAAAGCGVPAAAIAAEVSLSVIDPTVGGYLRAWPSGSPPPTASYSNFRAGASDTNTGSLALGADGALEVRNFATSGALDVTIDVQGYYVVPETAAAATFRTIRPCRIVDTRNGGGAMAPREIRAVQVAGTGPAFARQGGKAGGCAIPEGAEAVEVAISAVDARGTGFVRAWPAHRPFPNASVVNFASGQGTTNTASIALGPTAPHLRLRGLGSTVHLVLDVIGYWRVEDLNGAVGGLFHPMVPCRTHDTRRSEPAAPLVERNSQPVYLAGSGASSGGRPGGCAIPNTATAVETAVTAVAPAGTGFLRAWARMQGESIATIVNFRARTSATNTGAVPRSPDTFGDVAVRAYGFGTDLVLDAFGWYAPPGETVLVAPTRSGADWLSPTSSGSELWFEGQLTEGRGLYRWSETEGRSLPFAEAIGPVSASNEGEVVAFDGRASEWSPPRSDSQATDVWTYRPATGQLRQITQLAGSGFAGAASVSADGRHVGFVSDDDLGSGANGTAGYDLFAFDAVTSSTVALTPGPWRTQLRQASLSANGERVAFVGTDGSSPTVWRAYLWRRSDKTIVPVSPPDGVAAAATISADGSTVVFQHPAEGGPARIYAFDVATGATERLTEGDAPATAPTTSAGGRFVAYLQHPDPAGAQGDGPVTIQFHDRLYGSTVTIATGEVDGAPTVTRLGGAVFFQGRSFVGPGGTLADEPAIYRWERPGP